MEHRYQRPPSPGFRPPSPRNASLQRPSSSAGLSGGQPSSLPTGGFHSGALRRYSGVGIGGPPSAATNDWSASTRRVSSPYDSSTSFGIQQQQSRIVQPSSHPAQLPARRSSISTTAGRAPALPYARPSHGRSTSFSQSPPAMAHLSLHDPYSPVSWSAPIAVEAPGRRRADLRSSNRRSTRPRRMKVSVGDDPRLLPTAVASAEAPRRPNGGRARRVSESSATAVD